MLGTQEGEAINGVASDRHSTSEGMPTDARSSFHLPWELKNRSELHHCKQIARWTIAPRFCCPNYDEIFPSYSQVLKPIMQQVLYTASCPYKHTQYFIISCDTILLEDNLQKAAHELNQIITEYGLTISVQKTKLMALSQ